jgi:hypothetical protein
MLHSLLHATDRLMNYLPPAARLVGPKSAQCNVAGTYYENANAAMKNSNIQNDGKRIIVVGAGTGNSSRERSWRPVPLPPVMMSFLIPMAACSRLSIPSFKRVKHVIGSIW